MAENQKQEEIAPGDSVLNAAALLASRTQEAPQATMAAQLAAPQAKASAESRKATCCYNPAAVNPVKCAEQQKNRKMLRQRKKEGDKSQSA